MKARVFFESMGRSLRSRGFNWSQAKAAVPGGFYSLPPFAQSAVARGHVLQGPLAGGFKKHGKA